MTPDLVTVGGLTVDNVVAADGTVALNRVGGNAAYSAVGALTWVEKVGMVSVAASTYPRDTLDRLAANGIGLDGVFFADAALTSCDWFIYDEAGDRRERLRSPPGDLAAAGFPTDRLSPGERARWTEMLAARGRPDEPSYSQFRDLHPLRADQVPPTYTGARGVHFAPCRPAVLHALLPVFRRDGCTITLDAGWQLAVETLDSLGPLLAAVDAFLPSAVELEALVPGAAPGDALALLATRCRGAVAVKLGRRGSLVWDRARGEARAVPPLSIKALDPTGAGDAFGGGFLAGLVATGDPVLAACHGTVSASRVVACFGADGSLPPNRTVARGALVLLAASLGCPLEPVRGTARTHH